MRGDQRLAPGATGAQQVLTAESRISRRGLLAAGALGLLYLLGAMEGHGPFLRPPGAVAEAALLGRCLRCGACAQACPYNAIKLAGPLNGIAVGTPYIVARQVPCNLCPPAWHCARACPSSALVPPAGMAAVTMGTASLDRVTCLAWQGHRCEVCYRRCPLIDRAMTLERGRNRAGQGAMMAPVVQERYCVGCGLCEHVCVLPVPAIKVIPAVVKGV